MNSSFETQGKRLFILIAIALLILCTNRRSWSQDQPDLSKWRVACQPAISADCKLTVHALYDVTIIPPEARLKEEKRMYHSYIRLETPRGDVKASYFAGVGRTSCVGMSSDSKFVAAGTGSKLCVWDTTTGRLVIDDSVPTAMERATCISFAPVGSRLAVAGDGKAAVVYDTDKLRVSERLEVDGADCHDLAFSPNGKLLACAYGRRSKCRVWNVDTQKVQCDLSDDRKNKWVNTVTCCRFSPDSKMIATLSEEVRIWRIENGELISSRENLSGTAKFGSNALSWKPDGKGICMQTGDEGRLACYPIDATLPPTAITLPAVFDQSSEATSIVFSSDGKKVLVAGWGGRVLELEILKN